MRAQASWMEEPHTVGHWRTSDGDEGDFVIEFEDGRVIACEVKAVYTYEDRIHVMPIDRLWR